MNREVDYIIAIAECKSISKAAEKLYISQPSLSRYLNHLEEEIGTNLFVRTLQGTELTEAGRIYLKYAEQMQALQKQMDEELEELKNKHATNIRIGMVLNAVSLSAFNVAEKVKEKYPYVSVEMLNIMSKDIQSSLEEEKFDLAIGPDRDYGPNIIVKEFYRDPFVLVVPSRYNIESYVTPKEGTLFPYVDVRELPPMDYIMQEASTSVRFRVEKLLEKRGVVIEPKMEVTNSILALQAAENNIGCCFTAIGHMEYITRPQNLKFYQVSIDPEDYSGGGPIYLRNKKLTAEEKYCLACLREAMIEGEKQIVERLHRG